VDAFDVTMAVNTDSPTPEPHFLSFHVRADNVAGRPVAAAEATSAQSQHHQPTRNSGTMTIFQQHPAGAWPRVMRPNVIMEPRRAARRSPGIPKKVL